MPLMSADDIFAAYVILRCHYFRICRHFRLMAAITLIAAATIRRHADFRSLLAAGVHFAIDADDATAISPLRHPDAAFLMPPRFSFAFAATIMPYAAP
jgi:hypothetical protein